MAATSTQSNNNVIALFSYLGVLIIVPILVAKDDAFVKFHIKQGLVLIVFALILGVVGMIPVLGWLTAMVGGIVTLIFVIMGIMNALSNKQVELPMIGKYASKFNF